MLDTAAAGAPRPEAPPADKREERKDFAFSIARKMMESKDTLENQFYFILGFVVLSF